jgi:hypothetical protein
MRILAVVVVYHPDKELLVRNIGAFIDYVDKVIVWRNADDALEYLDKWNDKIIYMGDGTNKFLAYPINKALEYGQENGYDFLLTMDQDSEWINFKDFKETIARQWTDNNNVAIYSPNVNGYLKDSNIEYKDIEWVIQSGMLIDLKKTQHWGGFREDYEIYGIDEEYCYWLRLNGLKIRSFTNYRLKQKYGEARKSRFGFTVYNYSPATRYHLIRNMIWMKREFPGSTIFRRIPHVALLNLRDILLAEDNKYKKTSALLRGIYDGLFKTIKCRNNECD